MEKILTIVGIVLMIATAIMGYVILSKMISPDVAQKTKKVFKKLSDALGGEYLRIMSAFVPTFVLIFFIVYAKDIFNWVYFAFNKYTR